MEYGEYKGNLYGTSVDSVKEVLSSGKVCVVDIEPHVRLDTQLSIHPLELQNQNLVQSLTGVCVCVCLCAQAIQAVRSPELKAYIIFIKPPPLQRLRATRVKASVTTNYYVNRPFKVTLARSC